MTRVLHETILDLQANEHGKSMIERENVARICKKKKKRKGKPPLVVGVTNRHRREIEHEFSSSIPSRALVTGGCVCVVVRCTFAEKRNARRRFFREDVSSDQWCGKFEGHRFRRSTKYAPTHGLHPTANRWFVFRHRQDFQVRLRYYYYGD